MPHTIKKIPHSLRLTITLLRLAIGIDFFYFGLSILFKPSLAVGFRNNSFSNLYAWLAAPGPGATWVHPFAQWAILIIGALLILGAATRLASLVGIGVILLNLLPGISYASLTVERFINDEVVIVLCLLILFIANAGRYLGIDGIVHISVKRRKKEV